MHVDLMEVFEMPGSAFDHHHFFTRELCTGRTVTTIAHQEVQPRCQFFRCACHVELGRPNVILD